LDVVRPVEVIIIRVNLKNSHAPNDRQVFFFVQAVGIWELLLFVSEDLTLVALGGSLSVETVIEVGESVCIDRKVFIISL